MRTTSAPPTPTSASLHDRQAVVFGRASNCNAPVILELNDSARFEDGFWSLHKEGIPVTSELAVDVPIEAPVEPRATRIADDEDIPF